MVQNYCILYFESSKKLESRVQILESTLSWSEIKNQIFGHSPFTWKLRLPWVKNCEKFVRWTRMKMEYKTFNKKLFLLLWEKLKWEKSICKCKEYLQFDPIYLDLIFDILQFIKLENFKDQVQIDSSIDRGFS